MRHAGEQRQRQQLLAAAVRKGSGRQHGAAVPAAVPAAGGSSRPTAERSSAGRLGLRATDVQIW